MRWLLAFALAAAAIAVSAEGSAPCATTTRSEKIGSGTIVYNVAGAGPAVLLIHGLFANKEQWTALACLLADAGHATIAVDLPGYGKSEGFPLSVYNLDRQVETLHALIARLSVGRIDVAGNSMGGAIAALYARRYPAQVRSLAFIGSPLGIIGWNRRVKDAIYRGINPFIPVTVPQLDVELQLLFVTPPAIPQPDKKDIVADYARRNLHYVRIWNIVNLYDDVLVQAPPARIPTLIVWGEDDRIFDVAGAQRLHRRIAGSEVYLLPHAGHLLHLENAAEVAPTYVGFLGNTAAQDAARRDPAAGAQPASAASTIRASFVCDAGKRLDAVFVNGGRASVTLTLSDGRELSLPQALSASGARYANNSESFVFWNKGNTAFIEENGKMTYTGCTTAR